MTVGVVCNLPPTTSLGASYVKSIESRDFSLSGWLPDGTPYQRY